MIHSGAIIGAGIPQFRSLFFKRIKFPYPYFRSDRSVNSDTMHTHMLCLLCMNFAAVQLVGLARYIYFSTC